VKQDFEACDMAIFAAAPADYRPAHPESEKQPKKSAGKSLQLDGTDDVAMWAGDNRAENQILVGFAAETGDGRDRAMEKLNAKSQDFVVLNDISRGDIGFASDENEVLVMSKAGAKISIPKQSKQEVAAAILDCIIARETDE